MTTAAWGRPIAKLPNLPLSDPPPVLRVGTITIIGAAEIAQYRARLQALFGKEERQ